MNALVAETYFESKGRYFQMERIIFARNARVNEVLYRGAEAILYLEEGKLIKERLRKGYRIDVIDQRLRKARTKREGKVLLKGFSFVPKAYKVDEGEMKITMHYVKGDLLRDVVEVIDESKRDEYMALIGKHIAELHKHDVIHGALTTSNLILKDGDVYLIDFGLSFASTRVEDRAVDLHLFRQALQSTHHKVCERCFSKVLEGYSAYEKADEVLKRLEKVEQRGRYKRKMLAE